MAGRNLRLFFCEVIGMLFGIVWLLIMLLTISLFVIPVIYIWVIKPKKKLKDGLKDWVDESENDI